MQCIFIMDDLENTEKHKRKKTLYDFSTQRKTIKTFWYTPFLFFLCMHAF